MPDTMKHSCHRCNSTFEGTSKDYLCGECRETVKNYDGPESAGSEIEVEVPPKMDKEAREAKVVAEEGYQKKIHVDKDRQAVDWGRKDANPLEREKAKERTKKKRKETDAEKKKKNPLRVKLEELVEKKKQAAVDIGGMETEIDQLILALHPQEGDRIQKRCFGQYDANDYECRVMCPLRAECRVKAGA